MKDQSRRAAPPTSPVPGRLGRRHGVAGRLVPLLAPEVAASPVGSPFAARLVWLCAAAGLAGAAWLWLLATAVAVEAVTGVGAAGVPLPGAPPGAGGLRDRPGRGLPRARRHPAPPTPTPTMRPSSWTGLPLPDRAVGAHAPTARWWSGPGDTLWALAERTSQRGPRYAAVTARWHRIYHLQPGRDRPDPDLIQPGQRLRLPRPLTEEPPCHRSTRRSSRSGRRSRSPASRAPSPSTCSPRHDPPPLPRPPGRPRRADVIPIDQRRRAARSSSGRAATPRPPSRSSAATARSPSCCAGRPATSTPTCSAGRCWSPAPAGTAPGRAGSSRCARRSSACTPASSSRDVAEVSVHVRYGRAPARSRPAFELAGRWQCVRSSSPTGVAGASRLTGSTEAPPARRVPTVGAPASGQPLMRAVSPVGPPGAPWHCLYFLPEPQGHSALRPTPAYGSSASLAAAASTSASPASDGAE